MGNYHTEYITDNIFIQEVPDVNILSQYQEINSFFDECNIKISEEDEKKYEIEIVHKDEKNYSQEDEYETIIKNVENTKFDLDSKTSNDNKLKSKYKKFKISQEKSPKEIKSEQRADNMRKKVKVNFCQYLKKLMNNQLKEHQSKKLNLEFANWSQFFVANLSKVHNKIFLNQTFREFILDDSFKKGKKLIPLDFVNYENNYKILIYLENNNSNNSELNMTLNLKIKDLYNEYLHSDEFQNSIEILETYGKNNEYIDIYIRVANDFVNYYCSSKK